MAELKADELNETKTAEEVNVIEELSSNSENSKYSEMTPETEESSQ